MVKAKFGGYVRSREWTAQVNEVLLKILCHNICVAIQEMYELGIEPVRSRVRPGQLPACPPNCLDEMGFQETKYGKRLPDDVAEKRNNYEVVIVLATFRTRTSSIWPTKISLSVPTFNLSEGVLAAAVFVFLNSPFTYIFAVLP